MYNCNVKVVDMIMGSGKTSAAINYINESGKDARFLFITPYLDEVQRIKGSCPDRNFRDPKAIGGSKLKTIKGMIDQGINIVSTHALFRNFDQELIDLCRAQNYTLIMDEVADVIEKYEITPEDFNLLKEKFVDIDSSGFLKWKPTAEDYHGKFSNEKRLCSMNCLAYYGGTVMMWLFPVEVFNAFRNIYILTYMFESQIQKYYYDYYKLPYSYIYVTGDTLETYHFTEGPEEQAIIAKDYSKLIDICDEERLNSIGDTEYDLSKNWYDRNIKNGAVKQIKNNIYTYLLRRKKAKSNEIIWTTFKDYKDQLRDPHYGRGFLPLNTRGTNKYKKRSIIAYPVNRYINTGVKNFFLKNGIKIDEDGYALSEMLQFIWRSAIREGHPISIYIPSIRMRTLLEQWIKENSKEELEYE